MPTLARLATQSRTPPDKPQVSIVAAGSFDDLAAAADGRHRRSTITLLLLASHSVRIPRFKLSVAAASIALLPNANVVALGIP